MSSKIQNYMKFKVQDKDCVVNYSHHDDKYLVLTKLYDSYSVETKIKDTPLVSLELHQLARDINLYFNQPRIS